VLGFRAGQIASELARTGRGNVRTAFVVAEDLFDAECVACVLCSRAPGLAIAGIASVAAPRSEVANWRADLFLLDFSCAESVAIAAAVRAATTTSAIVAYRVPTQLDRLVRWELVGVDARVRAGASVVELAAVVDATFDGEGARGARPAPAHLRLTPRELDILRLIAEGRSNGEIAVRLQLQCSTVKNHVHNILFKLDARTRGEAGALYRETSFALAPEYGAPETHDGSRGRSRI
jgi:DNA-binding NarL/FixJ family response regulator